jgi:hypothetical protein
VISQGLVTKATPCGEWSIIMLHYKKKGKKEGEKTAGTV